jgi:lipid A 3-O-deacylase
MIVVVGKLRLLVFLVVFTYTLIVIPTIGVADEKSDKGERSKTPLISELGLISGYGKGSVYEGSYQVIPFILHIGIDAKIFFSNLVGHKGTLAFIIEPQLNRVMEPEKDIEFGIGVGVQYFYPLTERFSPYIVGVAGPHYINLATETQARGFIFSCTVGTGSYFFLTKDIALNIGYRLRHMSNAYTRSPNYGIDNNFAIAGLSVFFK